MELAEYQDLKKKIESAKTTKTRAEGARDRILEQLKAEFNITETDAPARLKELKERIDKATAKRDKLLANLETLLPEDER